MVILLNYCFILILTIILSINSSVLKENDELFLIQVEYQYNITKFNVSVLNRNEAEINDYLSSRIAFMNGSKSDDLIFDLYSNYINKYWLFLVNSTDVANKLLLKEDYKKNELYINGIIVPRSLNYEMPKENNNKKIPVFVVENNYTDYLKDLDIRNMKKHTYFLFEIKRAISSYPETYLLIIAILTLLIGLGLNAYWKVLLMQVRFIYILSIHKFLFSIPFFITLVSLALVVKAIDIRGQDPYREYDGSVYIDTALITLNAIFRTLLWFLILLICCGWRILIQNFTREQLRFFMKMFLIIYICMCLDQIIDSASKGIWVFHLSEIKNIVFYAWMLYLILERIKKNVNFLERRLYYARALSLEYVEALEYKINLINKFKMMLYSNIGFYLVFLFIHKVIVYPYDTSLLEVYDYYMVDLFLSIYFLYLLRPQTLPSNFNADLGFNENEKDIGNIYKALLPKYCDINNIQKNNKEQLLSFKGKRIPILVLGPCVSHYNNNGEEYSINNYINNTYIGYVK